MQIEIPAAALIGFSFALVRTTAWISVCPPFNSPSVPKRVRVGLATAISFVLAPQLGESISSLALGSFVLSLLAQALAGLALGFAVLMLFSAIQAAGDLIDLQIGFSLGQVLDPLSGSTAAPIGRFYQLLAITILFAVNGHVLVVRGYLRSVEAVPLGRIDIAALASQLVDMLTMFMIAALEIGLPVLAALFATEVALGLLGKAAPQLNILMLGFAAKSFVAILLLGMTLAMLPETTESLVGRAVRAAAGAFGG
ncbi:MAG: flagellar biosynthetic protein FliR [Ilumatobacteraceae bacterium]|nr:flagellar biosynthetic protein FliR [Ilumatobacteraceae bacterium]